MESLKWSGVLQFCIFICLVQLLVKFYFRNYLELSQHVLLKIQVHVTETKILKDVLAFYN